MLARGRGTDYGQPPPPPQPAATKAALDPAAEVHFLASLGLPLEAAAGALAEARRGEGAVVTLGDVEGVCRWLGDHAGVPIRGLCDYLLQLPEVLVLNPAQLQARVRRRRLAR